MLPLVAREHVFGLIELYRQPGAQPFTDDELQLAESLTAQTATAFENARLHTAVIERARELDALLTANAAVLSTLDLEPLLRNILTAAIAALPAAESGTIMLVEPSGQLRIRAFAGDSDPGTQSGTFAAHDGYAAKALRDKRPLLVRDARAGGALPSEPGVPAPHQILSAIVAPLLVHDKALGTIALEAPLPGAFSEDDQRLLAAFAHTAAIAIDHAHVHAEVQLLAVTDALTGLANYRAFDRALQAEVARAARYSYPLGLIIADVDDFKLYNDAYGHPAGNEQLVVVAALLAANVRDPDLAARYGGEEFALILPHTDRAGALALAERIRAAAHSAAPPAQGRTLHEVPVPGYTLSLGVASFPDDASTPEGLLLAADYAALAAKREGKNRVCEAATPLI